MLALEFQSKPPQPEWAPLGGPRSKSCSSWCCCGMGATLMAPGWSSPPGRSTGRDAGDAVLLLVVVLLGGGPSSYVERASEGEVEDVEEEEDAVRERNRAGRRCRWRTSAAAAAHTATRHRVRIMASFGLIMPLEDGRWGPLGGRGGGGGGGERWSLSS